MNRLNTLNNHLSSSKAALKKSYASEWNYDATKSELNISEASMVF